MLNIAPGRQNQKKSLKELDFDRRNKMKHLCLSVCWSKFCKIGGCAESTTFGTSFIPYKTKGQVTADRPKGTSHKKYFHSSALMRAFLIFSSTS